MSWFVALVQDANASHTDPYACAGSDNAKSSLRLCGLPALHTPILTPVQVPTTHTPILTPVQAPDNSHANPYACEGSQKCQKFLTAVQASNNSHANPYACEGSQQFTCPALCLFRPPTIHMPILTLVKAPKNAKNSLRLYRLPTIHTPILTLVRVANNADIVLRLCRLPTIHTPILTPVQAPNNSHTNLYACAGSQQLTRQSLRL
ncbi:hypothetical protein O181_126115 [Austropuccinia psidii MF-1]|uniref:Uncharacterized protein n=1 Tax=Austropuccinia psidii MF-1 TaxID=1389203 RepID=A0A9Q3Q6R5_9BASI|nr:hypothetical protein [Austropuccinia psidii MF-1]